MAKGYVANIDELTNANSFFRKVLYTSKHSQLVVMALKPGEEIGMEVHPENDQFFRIEMGEGKVIIDGNEYNFSKDFCIIIPAGSQHNVINTSPDSDLKVYTIYSPAHHKDGTTHKTKQDAIESDEEFDGITSE